MQFRFDSDVVLLGDSIAGIVLKLLETHEGTTEPIGSPDTVLFLMTRIGRALQS
jgi:hypothetical protein